MGESREVNRRLWDERAAAHAASAGYGLDRYRDQSFIGEIISFDRQRLGEVAGLLGVHLQCHIGTETVSLSRLGAQMTGLDFSPASLIEARRLAETAGADISFVEGDVYEAVELLGASAFDLVFTGIGALCWLPDITRWARVVAGLLRPGGRLFLREGHPVLWALGDAREDRLITVEYPYFERDEPTVFDEPGTYVDTETVFAHTVSYTWNHGLGEIVSALLHAGMTLTELVEHDSVPWEALPGQMEKIDAAEWRLIDRPWRLPHTYTLQAIKTAELGARMP
jgi:SAM-dependent methyltransferase